MSEGSLDCIHAMFEDYYIIIIMLTTAQLANYSKNVKLMQIINYAAYTNEVVR